ncbi:GNAT domain-containing protein [Chaetomidium leptoderma]|uniref:GNAT domain-containing protein n=1 Tax=Chaetomidium leptoderma TaxID=669021 RepID=A0AAN6VU42_9PEZI|nr:GNAT domain-containing protein [Chaetomidium leptoderma]
MSTALETPSAVPRPAPGLPPDPASFVRVRTTLPRRPLPPNAARPPVLTPRLVLRPLTLDDLPAVAELRSQPEVMHWTMLGRVDQDLDETRAKLETFLPPNDEKTYNFAICDRETGALIGLGGCHRWGSSFGWPEVGYMIRKEFWGKGLATEFLRGFLAAWAGLEREEVEVEVDERTVAGEGVKGVDGLVREQIIAVTAEGNGRSQGVLEKAGYEWFVDWLAQDFTKGSGPDSKVLLPTYRHFPGGETGASGQ